MLDQARKKMFSYPAGRLEFLKASPKQKFSQNLKENPDIITAIQCHHYLSHKDRAKATRVCYDLLKEGGVYIIFENIRSLTKDGTAIGKQYWINFQLSQRRNETEIQKHLERFDTSISR
jgi:tRNA (cmo5U34)-methyltransferase